MELYKISVNRNTLTSKFEKSENMELTTLPYGRLKYQQIYTSRIIYVSLNCFIWIFWNFCFTMSSSHGVFVPNKDAEKLWQIRERRRRQKTSERASYIGSQESRVIEWPTMDTITQWYPQKDLTIVVAGRQADGCSNLQGRDRGFWARHDIDST